MKELKPETAGNAPEPWMLAAAEELHRVEIGMEDGAVFDTIDQGEISIRARIIAKHYAASSQEAAPPLNDKAHRIADYFGVPVAFEAEPAPSPATKETPPCEHAVSLTSDYKGPRINCPIHGAGAKSVVAAPQLEKENDNATK